MSLVITSVGENGPTASFAESTAYPGQTIADPTPTVYVDYAGPDRVAGNRIDIFAIDSTGRETLIGSKVLQSGSDLSFGSHPISTNVALADGRYQLVARSAHSTSGTFAIGIDSTPERTPIIQNAFDDVPPDGPNSGSTGRTGPMETNDSTLTFRVTLEGANAGAGDRVEVGGGTSIKGSYVLTAQDVANGYAMVPSSGLSDGWQTLSARLIHADGTFYGWSSSGFTLRVDTRPPGAPQIQSVTDDFGPVTGLAPLGGSTDDATPTFRLGFDDETVNSIPGISPGHSPFAQSTLARSELLANGQVVATGFGTITAPTLAPGSYTFTARWIDTSGNIGATSAPFTLTITGAPPTPTGGAPTITGLDGAGLPSFVVSEADYSAVTAASVVVRAGDGLRSLTIADRAIVDGSGFHSGAWTSPDGAFTVNFLTYDAASGRLDFTVKLNTPWFHNNNADSISTALGFTATDNNGDSTQAVLSVLVQDAGPTASADRDVVAPGGTATGNLITDAAPGDAGDSDNGADRLGLDGAIVSGVTRAVPTGGVHAMTLLGPRPGTMQATYGTLTIGWDGNYTYTAHPDAPVGATESFGYWLQDPDGDQVSASLNIRVQSAGGPATSQLDLSPASLRLAEGDTGATAFNFTVTRSGPTDGTSTVSWRVDSPGTGSSPPDFVGGAFPSGTLTFAPGETIKTISVAVQGDTTTEGDEDFILYLQAPSGATLGFSDARGTIANDDAQQTQVGFTTMSAQAPDAAGASFSYTVTRTGPTTGTTTVNWSVSEAGNRTAFASDFPGGVLPSGTITFGPGEASKTIAFGVQADTEAEFPETFFVNLSNPSGATISTGRASGLITNDDPTPTLAFVSSTVSQAEGSSPGGTSFVWTLTRSGGDASQWFTAEYVVSSNLADGADFASGSLPTGRLTFEPGQTSAVLNILVNGDTAPETNEGFTVSVRTAEQVLNGTGIIVDDDSRSAPTFRTVVDDQAPLTGPVSNGGTTDDTTPGIQINLTGTGARLNDLVQLSDNGVVLGTQNVTPEDLSRGWVHLTPTLPNGQHSFTARILFQTGQGQDPGPVSSAFALAVQPDAQPPPPSGDGQVINSPGPGSTLQGGSGSDTLNASQGSDVLTGGGGADVFAWRNEPWSPARVTDFAVGMDRLNLSALFQAAGYTGSDPVGDGYIKLLSGPNNSTQILFDRDAAGPNPQWANYIIQLEGVPASSVTWASLTGRSGPPPPPPSATIGFSGSSVAAEEGNSGARNMAFNVFRSGETSGSITVEWAVSHGGPQPATAVDFAGGVFPSGVLSFAPGEGSKTILVPIAGDHTAEPEETFTVTLSNASGASIGQSTIMGRIVNDDASPPPSGQVLTSPGPNSTLTGGAGDDTLNASRGSDVLTGGGGADKFAWAEEPWSPAVVKDFAPGVDRLDLSALFRAAGYAGSDPVADKRIILAGQGNDTLVLFDDDGEGGEWPNYIIRLEGTPTGTSWAVLSTGGTAPAGTWVEFGPDAAPRPEGNTGSTAFNFTINRTGDLSGVTTVQWFAGPTGSPYSATGQDFAGGAYPTGAVTFNAGVSTMTFTVNAVGDTVSEPDEPFRIAFGEVTGGSVGHRNLAHGTIANDDGAPGQVINSPGPNSTLTGGAGNDTLNASRGSDVLTGGGGADLFAWADEPWSPARVTDFVAGQDKLDLRGLFDDVGYTGTDPFRDGYLRLIDDGAGGTKVLFDRDAGGPDPEWPNYIIQVEHVAPAALTLSNWIIQ